MKNVLCKNALIIQSINSLLASREFCYLEITFAYILDPDQDQLNISPDLDPNCLKLFFFFKKVSRRQQKHENLAMQQVKTDISQSIFLIVKIGVTTQPLSLTLIFRGTQFYEAQREFLELQLYYLSKMNHVPPHIGPRLSHLCFLICQKYEQENPYLVSYICSCIILVGSNVLLVLIWVQTVSKGYQQMTNVSASCIARKE